MNFDIKVTPTQRAYQLTHERRVVGHVSGWQEQMDTCRCGAKWPCSQAASEAKPNATGAGESA
jgi:hypothetical protein